MKHLKTLHQLNESKSEISFDKILKEIKKESKKKNYFGPNSHSPAFDEGKQGVIKIVEDIFKKYKD